MTAAEIRIIRYTQRFDEKFGKRRHELAGLEIGVENFRRRVPRQEASVADDGVHGAVGGRGVVEDACDELVDLGRGDAGEGAQVAVEDEFAEAREVDPRDDEPIDEHAGEHRRVRLAEPTSDFSGTSTSRSGFGRTLRAIRGVIAHFVVRGGELSSGHLDCHRSNLGVEAVVLPADALVVGVVMNNTPVQVEIQEGSDASEG